jgi:hypothetical protein
MMKTVGIRQVMLFVMLESVAATCPVWNGLLTN